VETPVTQSFVSVVTPFRDTASYLSQCIESVLAQSYSRFEYILSDNCSTDGSREIAEDYARRDPRIRLIRQPRLLSQVQHYNSALAEISKDSRYCKIVQADDFIFPECLCLMVQAFEQSDSIGLVSAYDLKGDVVRGSGFPYPSSIVPGKDLARFYLRSGHHFFGSPSTVMYRSSLIRECQPFYDERLLHEDTEKCMQILEHWDFAFVHQVLSYLRVEHDSISGTSRTFDPGALDRYIIVSRYASAFLNQSEAAALKRRSKQEYYARLAHEAVRLREAALWRYHETGLKTVGKTLDRSYLGLQTLRELLWMLVNPGANIARALRRWKRRPSETAQEHESFGETMERKERRRA
jgi:glycosyltransferase involved in cell wall biosynthesis